MRKFPAFPPQPRITNPWLRLTLPLFIGMFLAVIISLWPEIQCQVFAACSVRDQWCSGDCTMTCQATTKAGYVVSTSCRANVSYCAQTFRKDACIVHCDNSGNCNGTSAGAGDCNRLSTSGGYSYWAAGECVEQMSGGVLVGCDYDPKGNNDKIDCCNGSSIDPGPTPTTACEPEYGPPTITLSGYTPPYPIVIAQDPNATGVDIAITVIGGEVTNGCPNGPRHETLTGVTFEEINLAKSSMAWIVDVLSQQYPGAHVIGAYPLKPDYPALALPAETVTIQFHLEPYDPGFYELPVTAVQSDA